MTAVPSSDDGSSESRAHGHAAGTVLLITGAGGLLTGVLDAMNLLPPTIARWWFQSESLLILISILLFVAGLRMTWRATHATAGWAPRSPGSRFDAVVLYTRVECGLCDEARELLSLYREWLPPLVEVDIDADPQLAERFSTCVPVVEIDGKVRFRGRVSEILLRRLIDHAEPAVPTRREPIKVRRR